MTTAYSRAKARLENALQKYHDKWQRQPFSDDEIYEESVDARLIAELEGMVEGARVAESAAGGQAGGDNGGGNETGGVETESDDDDDVQVGCGTEEVVRASSPLAQGGETTCSDDEEDTRSHTTEVSYDYDFGSASEEEEDAPCCSDNNDAVQTTRKRGTCEGSDRDEASGNTTKKRPRGEEGSRSSSSKQSLDGSDAEDGDEDSREQAMLHFNERWRSQPTDEWYAREMEADAARAYGRE